jgi:hypothetical protein
VHGMSRWGSCGHACREAFEVPRCIGVQLGVRVTAVLGKVSSSAYRTYIAVQLACLTSHPAKTSGPGRLAW